MTGKPWAVVSRSWATTVTARWPTETSAWTILSRRSFIKRMVVVGRTSQWWRKLTLVVISRPARSAENLVKDVTYFLDVQFQVVVLIKLLDHFRVDFRLTESLIVVPVELRKEVFRRSVAISFEEFSSQLPVIARVLVSALDPFCTS